jgi:hypothetical protein
MLDLAQNEIDAAKAEDIINKMEIDSSRVKF